MRSFRKIHFNSEEEICKNFQKLNIVVTCSTTIHTAERRFLPEHGDACGEMWTIWKCPMCAAAGINAVRAVRKNITKF